MTLRIVTLQWDGKLCQMSAGFSSYQSVSLLITLTGLTQITILLVSWLETNLALGLPTFENAKAWPQIPKSPSLSLSLCPSPLSLLRHGDKCDTFVIMFTTANQLSIRSQSNQVHFIRSFSLKSILISQSHLRLGLSKLSLSISFLHQNSVYIYSFPTCPTFPAHLETCEGKRFCDQLGSYPI